MHEMSLCQMSNCNSLSSHSAAAAGPQAPQGVAPRSMNSTTRHVVVGTNEGGLPPPPHAFNASSSQLRHHTSRHRRNAPQEASFLRREAAAPTDRRGMPLNGGIPSAIDGPTASHRLLPPPIHQQRYNRSSSHHAQQIHELRLPPSDEQAVLQRVPRTHATVVAHDLPPPPTSSDAWSSTSSGAGSSSRSRKRQTAGVSGSASKHTTSTAHSAKNKNSSSKKTQDQYPMVASVHLANGGTVDSVNMSDGSPSSSDSSTQVVEGRRKSSAAAMHVTMDDPILRRKMVPGSSSNGTASGSANKPKTDVANKNMKRKLSAMSGVTSDDSSDSAKSDEAEAVGSGSDEGYNASSERQSGSGSGSGSDDGDSSEGDGNKQLSARGGGSTDQVGVTVGRSHSNSKRTETSSMSSSVLADFSSGMNEVGSIRSNSPSQSSLSSNGGNDMDQDLNKCGTTPVDKADETHLSDAAVRSKRDAAHLSGITSGRKRSKSEDLDVKPSALKRFSQSTKHPMISGLSIMEKSLQQKLRSTNHHHYHSQSTGRKMLEKSFLSAKRDLSEADAVMTLTDGKHIQARLKDDDEDKEASIFSLGQDIMAQVVSYLDPPEAHSFLTTPLSKAWLVTYTAPQELWKILCTSKPFYAKLDDEDGSSDSSCSFPICNDLQMRQLFGKYRLLYTSFVRCMKYLNRLQDDAINGRTPSVYTTSNRADIYPFNKNSSLKSYFAKARRVARSNKPNGGGSRSSSDAALSITSPDSGSTAGKGTEKAASTNGSKKQKSTRRLGRSMLTDRLLRPTQGGDVGNVNLPWSCAIYSVVNWMVAFADVEGIQVSCILLHYNCTFKYP